MKSNFFDEAKKCESSIIYLQTDHVKRLSVISDKKRKQTTIVINLALNIFLCQDLYICKHIDQCQVYILT